MDNDTTFVVFSFPKDYYPSKFVQLVLVAVVYSLKGLGISEIIASNAKMFLGMIGYDENESHLLDVIMEINFGFRMHLSLAANVIIIVLSSKLKKYYNSTFFTIFYNIYLTGFLLYILFFGNLGIARVLWYLIAFQPIMMGYAAWYLYANKKKLSGLSRYALPLMVLLLLLRTGYDLWESMQLPENEETRLYKFIFGHSMKFL